MKKLVLMLAVVFSASLFSCGNAEKAADATVVEEVAVVEDSVVGCGVDSCVCADSCACNDSVKCVACPNACPDTTCVK